MNSIKATKQDKPYKGWKNHPCRQMWYTKGSHDYANALVQYGIAVCKEWRSRGYKDTCLEKISEHYDSNASDEMPPWLGREDLHRSHRSMLVQKDPEYYKEIWPREDESLEYVWPTRE